MSELGSISGKLQQEEKTLSALNNALLVIEADALKQSSNFGISSKEVSEGQKFLLDFAERLLSVLKGKSTQAELHIVVEHIKSGIKPLEDWIGDLQTLIEKLKSKKKLSSDGLTILEDILSLLDSQFTEDLQRLYSL